MPKQPTLDQKTRKMESLYFGVSDNPLDDVNPFPPTDSGFENFLASDVGDLRWGSDAEVRKRSKQRFAFNFSRVLASLGVTLNVGDTLAELANDNVKNAKVAEKWARKAVFPPILP